MSVSVFAGGGGHAGWRLLSRTAEEQKAMVAADPQTSRETGHFRRNITKVVKAEDLAGETTAYCPSP